jgi:hypothetical protein
MSLSVKPGRTRDPRKRNTDQACAVPQQADYPGLTLIHA